MATGVQERRGKRRGRTPLPLECVLRGRDNHGKSLDLEARIFDSTHEGLGIETGQALSADTFWHLQLSPAAIEAGVRSDPWVRVCWCKSLTGGRYKIGLEYAASDEQHYHLTAADLSGEADLYEVMQVNSKADPDTIHRIYRLLAQRFHPDNKDTGDEEEFKRITRAYEVLGDPARRASYDAQFSSDRHRQWKIFHSAEGARGLPSEKPKRFAILHALYLKRVRDAHQPTLGIFELEDLLAIPREHIEFSLWYLKERGFLIRGDNNRFHITVAGVDYAEQIAAEDRNLPLEQRLLPAVPNSL